MLARFLLVTCLFLSPVCPLLADEATVDKLQSISVTIRSGESSGSGVLFTRKDGDKTRTFVWTAAHVVDNLRKSRSVIIGGDSKTAVEFADASIVNEFYQDGRRIGEARMDAKVLRYSDSENGEDLALLEVRKHDFVPLETSVEFYTEETPKIGLELYHVGSLLGPLGANSLTTGILSKVGRVLDLGANGKTFDQVAVGAFPGSSGGGVFTKSDGKYIGMLVRGAGEQFAFIVPVRRMRAWAKDAKVEWAMDRSVAMPSAGDLRKLPIEDAHVEGTRSHDEFNQEFPHLLHENPKSARGVRGMQQMSVLPLFLRAFLDR